MYNASLKLIKESLFISNLFKIYSNLIKRKSI